MSGIIFAISFVFSPNKGLITILRRKQKQKYEFAQVSLLLHLFNHSELGSADKVLRKETMMEHLGWKSLFLDKVLDFSLRDDLINSENEIFKINEKGVSYLKLKSESYELVYTQL